MNKIETLRKIIAQMGKDGLRDTEEADGLLNELKDEFEDADGRIKELEDQVKELESEQDDHAFTSVFLGLDTIEYRLNKGNLVVTQQVETFLNRMKKLYLATAEMDDQLLFTPQT